VKKFTKHNKSKQADDATTAEPANNTQANNNDTVEDAQFEEVK
jgi:hypothetical protein